MRNYFDDYRQQRTPCYQLMLKLCIGPEGDARPCCSMENAGNLTETNFQAILDFRSVYHFGQTRTGEKLPGMQLSLRDESQCECRFQIFSRSPASVRRGQVVIVDDAQWLLKIMPGRIKRLYRWSFPRVTAALALLRRSRASWQMIIRRSISG